MFARTFVTFLMVGACLQSVANDEGGRRVVLVEEFTNVACAPCAEFAVNIDKALDTRLNDVALITHHYNFPSPQDPFYITTRWRNYLMLPCDRCLRFAIFRKILLTVFTCFLQVCKRHPFTA